MGVHKMDRRFIENPDFPIKELNEKSEKEKGPARPPYWEMVFWWTRKPLIGARGIIAGSLLPYNIDVERFKTAMALDEKTPHRVNPKIPLEWGKYFRGKKLLDPFAGFGSIPLEGLRLGLDVTAVELLPTAYVFLKAVLEYPKKFGKPLVKDVEKWGNWITEQLKKDPEIRELYDEDVAVYIGTWEVKCPHGDHWTPIVGNWWLARVKDSKGKYQRLAYMKSKKNGDVIEIEIIDLNKIVGNVSKAKVDTKTGRIVFEDEKTAKKIQQMIQNGDLDSDIARVEGDKVIFEVPRPNIEARKSQITCLYCGNLVKYADAEGNHYLAKPKGKDKNDFDFYVKWALRKYHEGDERFARQRLLVKVKIKDRDLVFEPTTKEDSKKLLKAKEKVKKLLEGKDPDVPIEKIAPYGTIGIGGYLFITLYGFDKWYKLFNPRQLLTLVKIVKLIREVGKRVEEEKLKEGWDKEKAFEYAEAVATYLSIAMLKYAYYNSIVTRWDSTWWKIGETMSTRGIAMNWNWTESPWFGNFGGIIKTFPAILRGLEYLTSTLSSSQRTLADFAGNSIRVLQGDATSLNLGEKFDVIVTDPPYAGDVPYVELSDFYFVWLKRALSDSDGKKLVPRFHKRAFFKEIKIGGKSLFREIPTQWQEFALKEVSYNPGRFANKDNRNEIAQKHFEDLFSQAFVSMREHLKDNGLLVTYYAHTDPTSWANLLEAGWQRAKLQITRALPLTTESATSIVSRGKLSLDTSIVAVWKKVGRQEKSISISSLLPKLHEKAEETARILIEHGHHELDLLYGTMAGILEEVTKYEEIYGMKGKLTTREILEKYVYPATILGIINAIAREEIEKEGASEVLTINSKYGVFYTAHKILFGSRSLSANDLVLLRLATGINVDEITASKKSKGLAILKESSSTSSKEFTLYSPDLIAKKGELPKPHDIQKFLVERGINIKDVKIRTSVDALHLLEYYAYTFPRESFFKMLEELKAKAPAEVEEAINIARLIYRYFKNTLRKDEKELESYLKKEGLVELYLIRRLVLTLRGGVLA